MRRALVAAVPLVLVLAPLASAAPTVSPTTGAAADFQVVRGGRTSQVMLLVTTPQQGRPQVRVRLSDPSGTVTRWYGDVPAGAVTTTGTALQGTTTLRAQIGGLPLRVVWHVAPGGLMVSMGAHDSDGSAGEGWSAAGVGGPVDVTIGTAHCRLEMGLVGRALTYDTDGYGVPLSSRFAAPSRCSGVPNDLPQLP